MQIFWSLRVFTKQFYCYLLFGLVLDCSVLNALFFLHVVLGARSLTSSFFNCLKDTGFFWWIGSMWCLHMLEFMQVTFLLLRAANRFICKVMFCCCISCAYQTRGSFPFFNRSRLASSFNHLSRINNLMFHFLAEIGMCRTVEFRQIIKHWWSTRTQKWNSIIFLLSSLKLRHYIRISPWSRGTVYRLVSFYQIMISCAGWWQLFISFVNRLIIWKSEKLRSLSAHLFSLQWCYINAISSCRSIVFSYYLILFNRRYLGMSFSKKSWTSCCCISSLHFFIAIRSFCGICFKKTIFELFRWGNFF